ncbi:MAG: Holliday junction branch migration protein RuvA [Bacteroidaceae bacterium]|nr:Holliday junction branch migration protein RuvA [Bacteroidaceae bacterium]
MIDYIKGTIAELTPTYAVLENNSGIGFILNISLNTFSSIQDAKESKLYVYEAIREDAHNLFGFYEKQERNLFLQLTSVSGIGGSTAMMILSAFPPAELIEIIATGNDALLKKVKGVGAKTAQRIIVDLHDKVAKGASGVDITSITDTPQSGKVVEESIAALVMLGFPQTASQKVIQTIVKENPQISVEGAIKEALKRI